MSEKIVKNVLIVDDEKNVCLIVRERFLDHNKEPDSPYHFAVDEVYSVAESIQLIRDKRHDVVVLDVRLEEEGSGLEASFRLYQHVGWEKPVRIILTGYPSYRECVEAMRHGVWDYIIKEDVKETPMAQLVVNSAVNRLRQLDLRREQVRSIAGDWLPRHLRELQRELGGKLVAIWHDPDIKIIASGSDAFELEDQLKEWRKEREPKEREPWKQPFIVQIPPQETPSEAEV